MAWGSDVTEQLQEQLVGKEKQHAAVERDDRQVTVEVEMAGAVGLAADAIRLYEPCMADLAEAGRAIAGTVDYLLEPLRLLEYGDDRALLRSAPPSMNADVSDYYELWLQHDAAGTSIDIRRYRYDKGQTGRRTQPLNLTWETAGRLLDDLYRALSGVDG